MLFLLKRNNGDPSRSSKDTCLPIIGLFSAIIFIGGLGGLIYGKHYSIDFHTTFLFFTFSQV